MFRYQTSNPQPVACSCFRGLCRTAAQGRSRSGLTIGDAAMDSADPSITALSDGPNSALGVVAQSAVTRNAWRLLPFLAFASFVHYMDRTNIAFAALSMNR